MKGIVAEFARALSYAFVFSILFVYHQLAINVAFQGIKQVLHVPRTYWKNQVEAKGCL